MPARGELVSWKEISHIADNDMADLIGLAVMWTPKMGVAEPLFLFPLSSVATLKSFSVHHYYLSL